MDRAHTRADTHTHTLAHARSTRRESDEGHGDPNVYGQEACGRTGSSLALAQGTGGRQSGISASETETAQTAEQVDG